MVRQSDVTLSLFIAILAVLLFGLSQYQRRAKAAPAWVSSLSRVLIVAILVLVAYFFYDRFMA